MAKDYYQILGVDRKADEKAIKAAYRKLARQYHPDLNPGNNEAEAKFKEVSEAYHVLSDPEKRKQFDRFGERFEDFVGAGGPRVNTGPFDIPFGQGINLEDIFGEFMGGYRQGRGGMGVVPPRDTELNLELPLEDIHRGTQRKLTFRVDDACDTCNGSGFVTSGSRGMMQCPTCRGEGTVRRERSLQVKIPAGIGEGKKVRIAGGGSKGTNGKTGDLYVAVRSQKHPRYERDGDDLIATQEVPLTTAVLGGEVQVETLDSRVKMRIPEGSQNGQIFRLSGKGVNRLKGGRGDLKVKLRVQLPKKLTSEARALYEKLAQLEEVSV